VVHLNFPLREPLVPDGALPDDDTGRPGGEPMVAWTPRSADPPGDALERLLAEVEARPRGVVVCGRTERTPALGATAAGFAEACGYPVLADPLSGARRGPAAVAHYDAVLRDPGFAEAHRPELVLRVGDLPTSKPLRAWLAASREATHVALDPEAAWQDPDVAVGAVLRADPAKVLAELTERLQRGPDSGWEEAWRRADRDAAAAIEDALADELSEPWVAAQLGARVPEDTILVVASSMPVRDVETFWPVRDDSPSVLANRGANGIDGTISTAFGVAAATDAQVVLLTGDVALAHDVGGLLCASRLGLKLTIVLLNNDGGGIFHFLPVAGETDGFEEHVATPHGLGFAHAAALYGCEYERVADAASFGPAFERAFAAERTSILEIRTDREANLALHRRVWDAVGEAVRGSA
jgi:2-succinyl-5-enolpyruvyl-6-hydroxy-3-cyclohexene-1-carboxylate synthase